MNELMSAVAHDMKNPLSAARFSALMLRDPVSAAVHKELVEGIVESCDGMLGFIQERLERNARESHGGRLDLKAVDLDEVLEFIVQQNLPFAHAKNSSLELSVADPGPTEVIADYHGVCQVLDNLISNALKFSPPGSCVRVTAEKPAGGPFVLVRVTDEGPGLTEDDKAHLFEPYRRLSAKPTAGELSTGLGLSIARSLMERMEGELGYDSLPGKGACFWAKIKLA